MIELIVGTRFSESKFWNKAALGRSLRRLSHETRIKPTIFFSNQAGLPLLYNSRIHANEAAPILCFIHDDVWLDDHYFYERVLRGVNDYDVIGVAGNRRRVPGQPSWCHPDIRLIRDRAENLSGSIGHGSNRCSTVSYFGPAPTLCELMDGVLLAARLDVLRQHKLLFDEQFSFHFYDLDFCRTVRAANLRLATFPIAITHESGGNYLSKEWVAAYRQYIKKWGQ